MIISTLIGLIAIAIALYVAHKIGTRIAGKIQPLNTPLSCLDHIVSIAFGAMCLSVLVLLGVLAHTIGSSITAFIMAVIQ